MQTLLGWLQVASLASGLVGGLVAALWAYSKLVLERGLLPPARLWVTCESVGVQAHKRVLQVMLHLENLGNSVLIATDVRVNLRYLRLEDDLDLLTDPRRLGRLNFRHSVQRPLVAAVTPGPAVPATTSATGQPIDGPTRRKSGFLLVQDATFVQAGVHQAYPFVTAVPEDARFVLVHGSFHYAQRPTAFSSAVLSLSRQLGLIQFTLAHVKDPHTAEQVFSLGDQPVESEPPGASSARIGSSVAGR